MRRAFDAVFRGIVCESDVESRLVRIFSVAVCEDDSIGDHWRFRMVHVARDPCRRQVPLAILLLHLEGSDRSILHLTIFEGSFELRVLRSPEWRQYPARSALRVFPA